MARRAPEPSVIHPGELLRQLSGSRYRAGVREAENERTVWRVTTISVDYGYVIIKSTEADAPYKASARSTAVAIASRLHSHPAGCPICRRQRRIALPADPAGRYIAYMGDRGL